METTLTFNQFLDDYSENKVDKTLRGFFLINLQNTPDAFQALVDSFTANSRSWSAKQIRGKEQDFYLIVLNSEEDGDHFFFVKEIVPDSKYVVFTYEDPKFCDQFNRLLYSGKTLWKPWLGSRFLENFNQFMSTFYPASEAKLVAFSTEYRDVESKKKKGSGRFWIVRNKEDLLKTRKFQYESFGELSYIKRGKWKITSNGNSLTTITLSDRGEFSIKGDLYQFLDLGKGILDYSEHLKNLLSSKLNFTQSITRIHNQTVQTVALDNLRVIEVNMTSAFLENWFDNLLKIQEIGYLSEYRVMVFEKTRDEAHFMIEIVDIETGNKVYLSSNKQRISIAPGLESTPEPETISKILSMLQARVDPSITLGEDYGQSNAST